MLTNKIVLRSTTRDQSRKIYFQLQARSQVILTGHHNTNTSRTTINNSNNDTLELEFKLIKQSTHILPERKYSNRSEQMRAKYCDELLTFTDKEFESNDLNDERKMIAFYVPLPNPFKWYYDVQSDSCKKLAKKPTRQNSNKFDSKRLCENECKKSPCKPTMIACESAILIFVELGEDREKHVFDQRLYFVL